MTKEMFFKISIKETPGEFSLKYSFLGVHYNFPAMKRGCWSNQLKRCDFCYQYFLSLVFRGIMKLLPFFLVPS